MQPAGVSLTHRSRPLFAALALLAFSATGRGEQPTPTEPNPRDHGCPWLGDIFDDDGLPTNIENYNEFRAYNYFVEVARKFTPEQMAKATRPELTWRILFGRERSRYRGEIAHVEGRLKRLVWIGSNKTLETEAGVKDLYEAWIFGRDYFSNPICVVLSELPAGLQTGEDIRDVIVSADGYFFKRYKYRAANDTRLAPLVIARTVTVVPTVAAATDPGEEAFGRLFLPVVLSMVFGMVVVAFGLHRWFRSGDRAAHDRFLAVRELEFVAPTEHESRGYFDEPSRN
jgi:hypothetical protein